MVVNQQDVHARFHIAVLEGVVEQNDVQIVVVGSQPVDAVAAVAVDGNGHVGVFLLHLERFVADVGHGGAFAGCQEAFALSFVSSAEYCHVELRAQ